MSLALPDIYKHLAKPIIYIDCLTALPNHENIIELLQSAAARLKNIQSPGMNMYCVHFLLNQAIHVPAVYNTPQQFMKCKAMVSFHLGHFREATIYAGTLGLKYFCLPSTDHDMDCSHFNKIAGIAYEQIGNIEKACLHYNYFVYTGRRHHDPSTIEELLHALAFLLQHHALIISPDIRSQLIDLLEESVGSWNWNDEATHIVDEIRRIPDRYETNYYETELENAKKHLRSDMQYIIVRGTRGQKT